MPFGETRLRLSKAYFGRSAGLIWNEYIYSSFRNLFNMNHDCRQHTVFGLELTFADLIMTHGRRLEGAGVIPDKGLVPTTRALAEKADPLLAYSVSAFGVRLSAEDAGKYYFMRPVPEPGEEPGTSASAAK